jgi:hypothetical protein
MSANRSLVPPPAHAEVAAYLPRKVETVVFAVESPAEPAVVVNRHTISEAMIADMSEVLHGHGGRRR